MSEEEEDLKIGYKYDIIIDQIYILMQRGLFLATTLCGGLYFSNKNKAECCGIIGILSSKRDNIGDSLSMGVELLKNRGYDSAGIVTFNKDGQNVSDIVIKHAE